MIWGIAFGISVAGILLLALGLRGRRVGADETCRQCGYDLRGRAGDAAACPECGTSLATPGAIFRGRRRRRPLLIVLGTLVALFAGATAGLDRADMLNARTLDRLTPTSYLLWRADRDRGPALVSSVDRVLARWRTQRSRFDETQRLRFLDRLVRLHGDASSAWNLQWGEPIDAALLDGTLPPLLLDAYLQHFVDSVGLKLDPPIVAPGALIRPQYTLSMVRIRSTSRGVPRGQVFPPELGVNVRYVMRIGGAHIANTTQASGPDGFLFCTPDRPTWTSPSWGRIPRLPRTILQTLSPGPQVLDVELHFDVIDTSRRDRGTLLRASRTFRLPVTLLEAATTQMTDEWIHSRPPYRRAGS